MCNWLALFVARQTLHYPESDEHKVFFVIFRFAIKPKILCTLRLTYFVPVVNYKFRLQICAKIACGFVRSIKFESFTKIGHHNYVYISSLMGLDVTSASVVHVFLAQYNVTQSKLVDTCQAIRTEPVGNRASGPTI